MELAVNWLNRLQCWWKHSWVFDGGHWIVPGKYAITKRKCTRCQRWEEVLQDHILGMQTLEKHGEPPLPPEQTG